MLWNSAYLLSSPVWLAYLLASVQTFWQFPATIAITALL